MANFSKNVKVAIEGIRSFFRTEKNGRAMGVIGLFTISCGIFFRIAAYEWIWVLGCIALVICLEMMNSAVEKLCNLITTDYLPAIKVIKDMCAGAVLLASVIAAIIGGIIFLPYLVAAIR